MTVTVLPAFNPCVVPDIVGVVSLLSAIALILIIGAVKSIVPVAVADFPVLRSISRNQFGHPNF